MGMFAGGDQLMTEKHLMVVEGLATILPMPMFLVQTFASQASKELSAGFVRARDLINAFAQALFNGVVDGDAMMRETHGVALFPDAAKNFIESGVRTAMGGDDRDLAAPLGATLRHAKEFAGVFVKGELVQLDMAGLPGERIRAGGHGVNAEAAGELETVNLQVLFVIDDFGTEVVGEE